MIRKHIVVWIWWWN